MALFSVQFSALHYFIFSVYTNLNFNRMFFSTFQIFLQISIKKITIWHFYSNFSTPAIFLEKMEPMFVVHNNSIATDDDIIQFGDDVKIYPVYISRAIVICGNCLNWLEKTIVSDHNFCQFLVSWFGNSLMATECTTEPTVASLRKRLRVKFNIYGTTFCWSEISVYTR